MIDQEKYLTDIDKKLDHDTLVKHGLHKTLLVRRESIHWKHVFTEVFIRKTVDIGILKAMRIDLLRYVEIMTNRLRSIYKINREYHYENDTDDIINTTKKTFFTYLDLFKNCKDARLILDFDGVITNKHIQSIWNILFDKMNIIVCSANPTVSKEWFINRNIKVPTIYANKGMNKKLIKLRQLAERYPILIYVDDESKYLTPAWLLGIHTFTIKKSGEIKNYSLNSK